MTTETVDSVCPECPPYRPFMCRQHQDEYTRALFGNAAFREEWAKKEAEGYRYGSDALEHVRFGWDMAMAHIASRKKPVELTDLERSIAERIRDGGDPWFGRHSNRRRVSGALGRLKRKGIVTLDVEDGATVWRVTTTGLSALEVQR